jgi:elongation factor P
MGSRTAVCKAWRHAADGGVTARTELVEDVRIVIVGNIVTVSITESKWGLRPVGVYKTSDFRKGLKVQIDGEPYLMVEMNFVKPGKGNAMYKCRMRNLIRGTTLERTYKGGDSLESADVEEIEVQYLYRQGDTFVFMDNKSYEQYELSAEQVDDAWKYLKEGMACSMVLYNGVPITMSPPNHVMLKVEYCEPGVKGDTATNVTKPVKVETGAEINCPSFINIGNVIKVDTRTGDYVERVST